MHGSNDMKSLARTQLLGETGTDHTPSRMASPSAPPQARLWGCLKQFTVTLTFQLFKCPIVMFKRCPSLRHAPFASRVRLHYCNAFYQCNTLTLMYECAEVDTCDHVVVLPFVPRFFTKHEKMWRIHFPSNSINVIEFFTKKCVKCTQHAHRVK